MCQWRWSRCGPCDSTGCRFDPWDENDPRISMSSSGSALNGGAIASAEGIGCVPLFLPRQGRQQRRIVGPRAVVSGLFIMRPRGRFQEGTVMGHRQGRGPVGMTFLIASLALGGGSAAQATPPPPSGAVVRDWKNQGLTTFRLKSPIDVEVARVLAMVECGR